MRYTGRENFEEARILLPSKINFPLFASLAQGYWDWQLPFLVKYGFPLDFPYAKEIDLQSGEGNHASTNNFPVHVDSYLDTELNHGAIAGPYNSPLTLISHISCPGLRLIVRTGVSSGILRAL